MSIPFSEDLAFAHQIVDEASLLALGHFSVGVSAIAKADGSPVTVADHEVEQLLRARISSHFSRDCLIGEEFGSTGDADRKWIIDPIDGTSFFMRNDPNWRIHLALQVGEHLDLAVVSAPALGLRWWAQRGSGAYEADWIVSVNAPDSGLKAPPEFSRKLLTSNTSELSSSQIACAPELIRERLPAECGAAPPTPLPLVELVRGEIDAFVAEGFHLWDHAPWILLVEEAGGRFTDRAGGNRGDQGGGVYSNAPLHQVLTIGYCFGGANILTWLDNQANTNPSQHRQEFSPPGLPVPHRSL